jgi:hypothetical protein
MDQVQINLVPPSPAELRRQIAELLVRKLRGQDDFAQRDALEEAIRYAEERGAARDGGKP